jgi:type VI secretion system secreted protein Hcp
MYDAFLKIDGINGESEDKKHSGWIDILSFSHGVSQISAGAAGAGGSRTAGRCDLSDFSVVKQIDKATPKIFLACAKGDHISEVLIELCRDKQKYMEFKMADVLISAIRPGGASKGEDALPLEEVSFNPARIDYTYTETDHRTGKAKGVVTAYWDQAKNVGG